MQQQDNQYIIINGELTAMTERHIPLADRGFTLGDGLFETVRCYQGHCIFLAEHWQRLTDSAKKLNINLTITLAQCQAWCQQLLTINQALNKDSTIKLILTRGIGQRGLSIDPNHKSTLIISHHGLPNRPASYRLLLSDIKRNEYSPSSYLKSLNYLDNILAYQKAQDQDYDDAILLNTKNQAACSSSANIFIVKNNQVFTPAIESGILAGTTRQLIIMLCQQLNLNCQQTTLDLASLQQADEIFLSNALMLIKPVHEFIDQRYTKHQITEQLTHALTQLIQARLKGENHAGK